MALIKEPLDIDFLVDPRPLTKEEQQAVSDLLKWTKKSASKTRLARACRPCPLSINASPYCGHEPQPRASREIVPVRRRLRRGREHSRLRRIIL